MHISAVCLDIIRRDESEITLSQKRSEKLVNQLKRRIMKLYEIIPMAMVDEKELLNENQHNWALGRMG